MGKLSKVIGALGVTAALGASIFALPHNVKADGFTGNVWFLWNCADQFCATKITGITGTQESVNAQGKVEITYHTKMLQDTEVSATRGTVGAHPDASALTQDDYRFMWEGVYDGHVAGETLTTWADYEEWEEEYIGDDYDKRLETIINPTNAAEGQNIISTNGDRVFRLTIWHEGYFGVTNVSNPSELSYFPDFWDQGMFNPAYDVSGTTADNAQLIQAYTKEPMVTLSSDGTAGVITGVTALNVPESAVTITPAAAGKFNIVFNSAYYDNVTFEVSKGANKYYVRITRTTVGLDWDGRAFLYIPAGEANNYDVLATYYLADGSSKTEIMQNLGKVPNDENASLNIDKYEYTSPSLVSLFGHREWTGVSFTIVRKGSTSEEYAGTLAGSKRGIYYTVRDGRNFVLGETR